MCVLNNIYCYLFDVNKICFYCFFFYYLKKNVIFFKIMLEIINLDVLYMNSGITELKIELLFVAYVTYCSIDIIDKKILFMNDINSIRWMIYNKIMGKNIN